MRDIDTRRILLRTGAVATGVSLVNMLSGREVAAQRLAPYKENPNPTPEQVQAGRIISGLSILLGIPTMIGVPIWLLRSSYQEEMRAKQTPPTSSETGQNT